MTLPKLVGVSTVGLMVMATAAMAALRAVAPAPSAGSVLVADHCPPGSRWVPGSYSRHGSWVDAHCVNAMHGSTAPPSASPRIKVRPPVAVAAGVESPAPVYIERF